MLDAKNIINLTGGIVADPERPTENIAKFRVAVDWAGSEKGTQNNTGYFDVVYYLNNEDGARNAKFVKSQLDDGKMKKGSQISLIGRLVQERWTTDGKNAAKVVIVAESISYASSSKPEGTAAAGSEGKAQTELPGEF